jgi:hypothetical protein
VDADLDAIDGTSAQPGLQALEGASSILYSSLTTGIALPPDFVSAVSADTNSHSEVSRELGE